ncbi:MAG: hypothetical protein A2086_08600 [Spirochaetes bacterium GWD1_27_9]|nr:MAG: hypothetical protein A2Z98_17740 [Spirochaetes bacterium GWB1_27_13]OHD44444.1 MAG: hypothetical protein A2086_08600 [Spirochaetes bacterium GWD1_27_9]
MKFKSKIILFIIFITYSFLACATFEKTIFTKVKKISKLTLNFTFAKDIKVNDKTLIDNTADLMDTTSDLKLTKQKIVDTTIDVKKDISGDTIVDSSSDVKKDSTTDTKPAKKKIDWSKYIYNKQKLKEVREKESLFYHNIFKNLIISLNRDKIKLLKIDSTTDTTTDSLLVDIKADIYNEGEFNLINNIPTEIKISVLISENNKKIAVFKKNYTIDSSIEYPTEKLRITNISAWISDDIQKILKEISSQKTTDTKQSDKKNSGTKQNNQDKNKKEVK